MAACYQWIDSPIGRLLLVADELGLNEVWFEKGRTAPIVDPEWRHGGTPLREPIRQLQAYFAGDLQHFALTLRPKGTPFQLRCWEQLQQIPFGETTSYGELARRVGNPAASRAVGLANGSNPIPVIIPCHRVIGSTGKLVGFGGGLETKRWLLDFEASHAGLFASQSRSER